MKRTKRIASVLLALVMALSLITTAFAAGSNSITVMVRRRAKPTTSIRCWTCP